MTDITRILLDIELGNAQAAQQLLPLVYDELRKLAAQKLAHEKPGQTLQATALVHEAYLRLVGTDQSQPWDSRAHFLAAAAEAMRRILIENARRKMRVKHGGQFERVDFELIDIPTRMTSEKLLALDDALVELGRDEPRKAQLVTLRYFGGMTIEQAADMLKISRVTAHRDWKFARAWLHGRIAAGDDPA
jgi:RNA polymerase sigma factor (TIGR02999 family)